MAGVAESPFLPHELRTLAEEIEQEVSALLQVSVPHLHLLCKWQVGHLLAGCVQYVATQQVIIANRHLLHELEDVQRRCFADDELQHQRVQRGRCGGVTRSRQRIRDTLRDSCTDPSQGSLRKGRRVRLASSDGVTLVEASVGMPPRRATVLGGGAVKAQELVEARCGGGGAPRSGANNGGHHGSGGSKSRKPTMLRDGPTFMTGGGAFADSQLASSPPRSQFAFDIENRMHIHSSLEADRQLQRRLSSLNALQLETAKLERKQRQDISRCGALFFKLTGADDTAALDGHGPTDNSSSLEANRYPQPPRGCASCDGDGC